MKTTVTAIALVLSAAAPSFAASSDQLRNNVENSLHRIDSSIVLPDLGDEQLAYVKRVIEETDYNNTEKSDKVRFYISTL